MVFGLDLKCGYDLDPAGFELDPESPESVAQEILHRLDMRRGTLVYDDENAGLPLSQYSSKGFTPEDLAALPGAIRAEILKARPRVIDAEIAVSVVGQNALRVAISVTLSSRKTFPLVIEITKAGAAIAAGV